jgi:hypothetical protein
LARAERKDLKAKGLLRGMKGNKEKPKKKKPSLAGRIIRFYVFLWPTLRTYTMWFKYFKHKKKHKKEKIVIIEE